MSKPVIDHPVSIKAIATLLDLSERRIQQLEKEGIFRKVERGKYDITTCVQGYVRYLDKQIEEARSGNEAKQQAETEIAQSKNALLKLKLAEARGQAISVDLVAEVLEPIVVSIRSTLRGIPKHAARELADKSLEAYLEKHTNKALDELSTIGNKLDRVIRAARKNAAQDAEALQEEKPQKGQRERR